MVALQACVWVFLQCHNHQGDAIITYSARGLVNKEKYLATEQKK